MTIGNEAPENARNQGKDDDLTTSLPIADISAAMQNGQLLLLVPATFETIGA